MAALVLVTIQSSLLAPVALAADVELTPTSHNFGSITVGASSEPTTFMVIDNGWAGLLFAGRPTITGNGFTLGSTTCRDDSIPKGGSCSFQIVFAPTTAGPHTATVSVETSPGTLSATLTGTGTVAASLTVTPDTLAFDAQAIGTTSEKRAVTIENIGDAAIQLGSASIAGSGFGTIDDDCSNTTLEPDDDCTLGVVFAPTATGPASGTLTIASDAPEGPHEVALSGNGFVPPAPAVQLSATSHAFGDHQIGSPGVTQQFTLTNTGTGALHLGALTFDGATTAFALSDNTCSAAELDPLDDCAFTVTFAPPTLGPHSATVTIPSDAASTPDTIALSGTGTAPPAPVVSLSTESLAFGDQVRDTPSAPQSVTVQNDGGAPLTIAAITLGGADSAQFALAPNSCTETALAPDDTCTFDVTFAPTTTGSASATLSIASNAAGSPHTVALSGTGLAPPTPTVALSTTSLDFGDQQVGTTSATQPVTLTNSGSAPLTITGIAASGDFAQSNDCPASLAVTTHCTIEVTFSPTTTGERNGTLTITSDASSSPDSVALSGTGTAPPVPVLSLSTTSHNFGNQQTGSTSTPKSITVTNTGDGQLTIGTLTLSGATDQFAIAENDCLGANLGHSESCAFDVTFSPAASGTLSATVSVPSNAASSPDDIALSGLGTAPSFSIAPRTLDFGSQPIGITSAQQSVIVTNTGFGPVAPGGGTVSGPGFAIVTDECAPTTLTPTQTCAITLTFTPGAPGPASGTLTVGPHSVTLDGTGTGAPIATTLAVAPASGTYGGTVTLSATLRNSATGAPLAGKSITFSIGGAPVGAATTDAEGVAALPNVALGTRGVASHPNAMGASFLGDGTALASSGTANLTVTRATLTVTADDQTRPYASANPSLTVKYSGFRNDETSAVLTGRPGVTTTATTMSNAGSYPITVTRSTLNAANYTFLFTNGTLTVVPTPLTITAVDKSRTYGAANPALTVQYSGFRMGDNADDLRGTPSITTAATPSSPPGAYPITVGQGTISSVNYTYTFVNGTLTIAEMNTVISSVSGAATYGGTATLTATLRQGTWTGYPLAGATIAFTLDGIPIGSAPTNASGVATLTNVPLGSRGAGNYANLVGATFAGNANQRGDTATGTLRVAKAALVLKATDQTRRVGQANPPCQVELAPGSSFVNGDTLASLDLQNLWCSVAAYSFSPAR